MCIHEYIICVFLVLFLQEECVLSDPQGDSDADADIEDTDNRFDCTHFPVVSVVSTSLETKQLLFGLGPDQTEPRSGSFVEESLEIVRTCRKSQQTHEKEQTEGVIGKNKTLVKFKNT